MYQCPYLGLKGTTLIVFTIHVLLFPKHDHSGMKAGSLRASGLCQHFAGTSPVLFSVAQSCLTLCDPMDCSMPGLPVLHYLPEFAQTHVH